jgi:hypothetical protein
MRPGLEIAHLGGDRPCAPCVEGGEEAGDASGMRAITMTYGVQQGREDISEQRERLGAAARDERNDSKKFAFADGEGAGRRVVSSDDGCE